MRRGEVWLAVWPNDPDRKPRPVLIVSNNFRNSAPHLLDVIVAKLTGLQRQDGSRKPVNRAEDLVIRFRKDTIVRCASLFSIEKKILTRKVAALGRDHMSEIDARLRTVLGLG